MKTTVSLEDLERAYACEDQRDRFRDLFDRGPVQVTPELCEEHREMFEFSWAAYHLLTVEGYVRYLDLIEPTRTGLANVWRILRSSERTEEATLRLFWNLRHVKHVDALAFATAVREFGTVDPEVGQVSAHDRDCGAECSCS